MGSGERVGRREGKREMSMRRWDRENNKEGKGEKERKAKQQEKRWDKLEGKGRVGEERDGVECGRETKNMSRKIAGRGFRGSIVHQSQHAFFSYPPFNLPLHLHLYQFNLPLRVYT